MSNLNLFKYVKKNIEKIKFFEINFIIINIMSKTLFEDVLDDFFLRSIKKRSEPIDNKVRLGNYFYIGSSKNKNSFF